MNDYVAVIECGYCGTRLAGRADTRGGWDRIRCNCGAEFNWTACDFGWEIVGIHDPPSKEKKDV